MTLPPRTPCVLPSVVGPPRDVEVVTWFRSVPRAAAVIEAVETRRFTTLCSGRRGLRPTGGLGRPSAQGRDLQVPAGAGADRAAAGRLAGCVVTGRSRCAAPAGPHRCGRCGCLRLSVAGSTSRTLQRLASDALQLRPATHVTWPTIFTALLAGRDLGAAESAWAMDQIMSGDASPAQVAGFLMALRAKGETVEEMRGLATRCWPASRIDVGGTTLDIVGTGESAPTP